MFSIKRIVARSALVLLIVSEMACLVQPRMGSSIGESYRNGERLEALKQLAENPTPATQLKVNNEMNLLDRHVSYRWLIVIALLLILDSALIFFFWNFGDTSKTA